MGLTVHGASKRPATSEKNGAACESALRKNGQTVLAQLEPSQLRSSKLPSFAREDFIRAPCRDRRQLPPTRRSPSRASQRLTMCQRLLSTPCAWTQAFRPRERQESVALHTLSQEDVVGHVAPTRRSPPRVCRHLDLRQRQGHHAVTDGIMR